MEIPTLFLVTARANRRKLREDWTTTSLTGHHHNTTLAPHVVSKVHTENLTRWPSSGAIKQVSVNLRDKSKIQACSQTKLKLDIKNRKTAGRLIIQIIHLRGQRENESRNQKALLTYQDRQYVEICSIECPC